MRTTVVVYGGYFMVKAVLSSVRTKTRIFRSGTKIGVEGKERGLMNVNPKVASLNNKVS